MQPDSWHTFVVVKSCPTLRPHGQQHTRLSCPWLSPGVCSAAHQAFLPLTISWSLLRFTSIDSVMLLKHLILCHLLFLLPSTFPSIRVFSNESALCIRWPKYWSFSFSISPSNDYSVLISFRVDYFDLLAVQGTLKSVLQHHNLKASVLWCSVFFWSNSHIHTWLLEKPWYTEWKPLDI